MTHRRKTPYKDLWESRPDRANYKPLLQAFRGESSKEFSWGQWTSRRRDERDSDFAPPSAYFTDNRKGNYSRAAEKGQGKAKLPFKWSESQRATESDTDNTSTTAHASNIPTCTQYQHMQHPQPQTDHTQSLDDLLSFYKHAT